MLAPSQTGVWLSVSIGCQGREEGVVQIYQNDISAGNQSDFWRKKCPQYLWIKIILVQKLFILFYMSKLQYEPPGTTLMEVQHQATVSTTLIFPAQLFFPQLSLL